MSEFFHSQAFAFLLGCFIGGLIGFIGAVILAASGRASRTEEEMYEAMRREAKRRGDYLSSKQMVSDVEDILGRKVG